MKFTLPLIITFTLVLNACKNHSPIIEDWEAYLSESEAWQKNRLDRLKSENGWLNLAGLFWLNEGENTFGSDSSNTIIFPENFPSFGGNIILDNSTAYLYANKEAEILVDSMPVAYMELKNDMQQGTTIMELRNYRWFIIKRGDRLGIRLRDLKNPRLGQLDHIPCFPVNKDWIVEAKLIPFDSSKTIEVPTAIENYVEYYTVPGELHFRMNGKELKLLPFAEKRGYFLIVGDATNGLETYGAGRFMFEEYREDGRIILDFNRLTNPPCAFSPFATCPLPPIENILDIEITAGEKAVHID